MGEIFSGAKVVWLWPIPLMHRACGRARVRRKTANVKSRNISIDFDMIDLDIIHRNMIDLDMIDLNMIEMKHIQINVITFKTWHAFL